MEFKILKNLTETYVRREVTEFLSREGNNALTEQVLKDIIKVKLGDGLNLNEEDCERAYNIINKTISVVQKPSVSLNNKTEEWLDDFKKENSDNLFYYWSRYKKNVLEDKLKPRILHELDKTTDRIIDFCGNPKLKDEPQMIKGLVMGHVQSGKTANYTGVVTKAADVGFKCIVILTTSNEALRRQTQDRLNKEFIGRCAVTETNFDNLTNTGQNTRYPFSVTTINNDFSRPALSSPQNLNAITEPYVFVCKKNKNILDNFIDWLTIDGTNVKLQSSLLIIDDEADYASVNTNRDDRDPTKINECIRRILSCFHRCSYVGYTATPFANIFIEPESDEEMESHDLFPSNFIEYIQPPDNYMGLEQMVKYKEGSVQTSNLLHFIEDWEGCLPKVTHKRDSEVNALPESLNLAIRCFLINQGILNQNKQTDKHHTMMINVSRFTDVNDKIVDKVDHYFNTLKNSIKLTNPEQFLNSNDENIQDIKNTLEMKYSNLELDENEIFSYIKKSIDDIEIHSVFGRNNYSRYDDPQFRGKGLKCIKIGGDILSRGLTLEGLSISYYYRKAGAKDTLMQMGRWFGYRQHGDYSYLHLCKIFLLEDSYGEFEDAHETIEDLIQRFQDMSLANKNPLEFGLAVRRDPTTAMVTAISKCRTGFVQSVRLDYSGKNLTVHKIFNDERINEINKNSVDEILSKYKGKESIENNNIILRDISGNDIYNLLCKLKLPDENSFLFKFASNDSTLGNYILEGSRNEFKNWDVVIPSVGKSKKTIYLSYLKDPFLLNTKELTKGGLDERRSPLNKKIFLVNNGKNTGSSLYYRHEIESVISNSESEEKPVRKINVLLKKPVLVIHYVYGECDIKPDIDLKDPYISFSFHFPISDMKPPLETVMMNTVMQKKQLELQLDVQSENDED